LFYEESLVQTTLRLTNMLACCTGIFLRSSSYSDVVLMGAGLRDVRGFAIKFYTDQGNWDLTGNNLPVSIAAIFACYYLSMKLRLRCLPPARSSSIEPVGLILFFCLWA
jgi:hypothetical protein